MATFKVGDKVRIRGDANSHLPDGAEGSLITRYVHDVAYGLDGQETPLRGSAWKVAVGCHGWFAIEEWRMEPLTPPDAWAADAVRKVTRPVHVEPVVVKEKA